MGKGYKKFLALALSIILILQSPVMAVSAASSDLEPEGEVIETLAGDLGEGVEADPGVEVMPEEKAEGEGDEQDGQDDQGLLTEPGSDQNPDGDIGDFIEDDEKLRDGEIGEELGEVGLGEDSDKDLEDGLDEDLEKDLDDELDEKLKDELEGELDEELKEGIDGEAKPVLRAGTVAEASEDFVIEDGVLVKYNGTDEEVVIPDGVVKIARNAFFEKKIKSVRLSDSVKTIDSRAFMKCQLLEEVDFGKVEEISSFAFTYCNSLKNMVLPDSLIKLNSSAFYKCENIYKVIIPVRTLCFSNVFKDSSIRHLYFENGRSAIQQSTLGLATVEHIYVPRSVASIGYIPEGAMIHGENGSFAQQYASDNNFRFFNSNLYVIAGTPISVIDGGASEGDFIWESDNEAIATVDDKGYVYGVSNGTCNITAKKADGSEVGSCAVTVSCFEIQEEVLVKYNGTDEEVVIPDGVLKIQRDVFSKSQVRRVTLPDSVKVIDTMAFSECRELEYINLENVEKIGGAAFAACGKLEEVNLTKAVEIGAFAFRQCSSLSNVELPDSLENLKDRAFLKCGDIYKVTIPKGTVCGASVFSGSKIRQLYFEAGRTEIPEKMLSEAIIEHIYVPNSVTSIGYIPEGTIIHGEKESSAQQYAKDNNLRFFNTLLSVEAGSTVSVIDGGSSEGEFIWESDNEIIAKVDEYGSVTGISSGTCTVYAKDSDGAVINACVITTDDTGIFEIEDGVLVKVNGSFEEVVIPDGVVEIGPEVFYRKSLKSVTLPESVKVIGKKAFYECGLEQINLGNVEIIEEAAFYCNRFEEIDLGKVVEIGAEAFSSCSLLERVNLEKVEKIGRRAFEGCWYLKQVNLENVEKIEEGVFSGCERLEEVKLGKAVEIGDFGFYECFQLKQINLGNVERIGDYAFRYCHSLEEADLKKAVIIGCCAFASCISLKKIELSDSLEKIVAGAFEYIDISKLTIPKGAVLDGTLFGFARIRQLYFEDGRTYISETLFDLSDIKHVYVPKSVTSMGGFDSSMVIHGESGSYAQEYAKEYGISFFNNALTVGLGSTIDVIEVNRYGTQPSNFFWESEDESIATVDEKGKVYGRQLGSCKIYAVDLDGTVVGSCEVTTTDPAFEIKDGVLVKYNGTDEDVVIPDGVTEIGEEVFCENTAIMNVKLPTGLKVIGEKAFYSCSNLEHINLEDVEKIGDISFYNCVKLEEANLVKVVEIGRLAFSKCKSIKIIELSESLEKLGSVAFSSCEDISKVTIPNGTVCVDSVFQMSTIRQLYFGDMTKEIPQRMLDGAKIEHVYVPKEVTTIGNIPEGAIIHGENGSAAQQYANDNKFRFFNNELTVEAGSTVIVIDGGSTEGEFIWEIDNEAIATVDTTGAVSGVSEGTCTVYAKAGDGTVIGSCEVTVNKPIFEIKEGVLIKYNGRDERVVIPDGIIEIGERAFLGNKYIREVIISESVKKIGYRAFRECQRLSSIDFGKVEEIGKEAFYSCPLNGIKLPEGLEVVDDKAFYFCAPVLTLELPDSLRKIGQEAFSGSIGNYGSKRTYIEKIVLPRNLEEIGTGAFTYIARTPLLFIPKEILQNATIGKSIFEKTNVSNVYYEDGIEEIPEGMLYQGNYTFSVHIPESVTKINGVTRQADYAFINGKPGSYAEQYAKENNFDFYSTELSVEVGERAVICESSRRNFSREDLYKWEIDDESIATVDQYGVVQGLSKGTCKIYLKYFSVDKDTTSYFGIDHYILGCCEVTVKKKAPHIVNSIEEFQSDHDYANDCDETWEYADPEADKLAITFSEDTEVEEGADKIYITDENDNEIGVFTGKELAGKTIIINSGTVRVGLESNESNTAYGFRVTRVLRVTSDFVIDQGELIMYIGNDAYVTIPDEVKEVGPEAFTGNTTIKLVRLPESVTTISESAFSGCTGLEHISIPKETAKIGYIPEKAMIHAEAGSAAHQYAKDHDIRFFNTLLSVEAGSTISVIDGGSTEGEFTWESDNEAIATVDTTGVVSGVSEGSCKVTAKKADGTEIGSCVINVTKKARIVPADELTISQIPTQEYIGGELQPKPEVRDGEAVLEEGKHYTLTYASNKKVGTGYVTVTGVPENGYEGTKKISFKIKAFDIVKNEGERFVISYEDTVEYNVAGVKPKVSVTFNNADGTTKKLKAGTDYTVSYKNNKKYSSTAKPTIIITAKGNYTGKKELNFTIKERDISKACMIATDMLWLGCPNTYSTITAITDSGYILLPGVEYESLKYVYAEKTVVRVNGKKVTRKAGEAIGKNDIIPADTTLKVIATAKKGSGYTGSISATYRLYSLGTILGWLFG